VGEVVAGLGAGVLAIGGCYAVRLRTCTAGLPHQRACRLVTRASGRMLERVLPLRTASAALDGAAIASPPVCEQQQQAAVYSRCLTLFVSVPRAVRHACGAPPCGGERSPEHEENDTRRDGEGYEQTNGQAETEQGRRGVVRLRC
jgi:hypothetical protein